MYFIVIGIGINVNQATKSGYRGYCHITVYETATQVSVDLLIQNICGNIVCSYDRMRRGNTDGIIDKWNEYSIMNNAVITYTKDNRCTAPFPKV